MNNGPTSLVFVSKFDDLNTPSTVFNKKSETDFYFSVDIKKNMEPLLMYEKDGVTTYQTAEFNELVFTIYGLNDVIEQRYVFDMLNSGKYTNQHVPYIITFNGDLNNPEFHLYVDGVEPLPYEYPSTISQTIEEQAGTSDVNSQAYKDVLDKLKSNLYGKVINLGSSTALVNKPDYSYIPLKNYQIDYITGEKYGYENAINTTEIMAIKKQLALGEVAFLTNVFSKLEENQLNFL